MLPAPPRRPSPFTWAQLLLAPEGGHGKREWLTQQQAPCPPTEIVEEGACRALRRSTRVGMQLY